MNRSIVGYWDWLPSLTYRDKENHCFKIDGENGGGDEIDILFWFYFDYVGVFLVQYVIFMKYMRYFKLVLSNTPYIIQLWYRNMY